MSSRGRVSMSNREDEEVEENHEVVERNEEQKSFSNGVCLGFLLFKYLSEDKSRDERKIETEEEVDRQKEVDSSLKDLKGEEAQEDDNFSAESEHIGYQSDLIDHTKSVKEEDAVSQEETESKESELENTGYKSKEDTESISEDEDNKSELRELDIARIDLQLSQCGILPQEPDTSPKSIVPDSRLSSDFEYEAGHGYGSFGDVLKCMHKLDKEIYAIKRLPMKGERPMEVLALARLKHPNIVQYHQAWTEGYVETGHTPIKSGDYSEESVESATKAPLYLYIQMQFCPLTIGDMQNKIIEREMRWQYFKQLVEGVRYIHGKGICHCDISPKNILLDDNMQIRICDFGLARFLDLTEEADMEPLVNLGNLPYRAPELHPSGTVTEKVDIYSIGVMLVDIFDNWATESEKFAKIQNLKKRKELPEILRDESPDIQLLLFNMVEWEADIRPTAAHILEALASERT